MPWNHAVRSVTIWKQSRSGVLARYELHPETGEHLQLPRMVCGPIGRPYEPAND